MKAADRAGSGAAEHAEREAAEYAEYAEREAAEYREHAEREAAEYAECAEGKAAKYAEDAEREAAEYAEGAEGKAAEYAEGKAAEHAEDAEREGAEYAEHAEREAAEYAEYAEREAAEYREHAESLGVRLLARLIPASDRQAILGDLLEDAVYRNLRGARLHWWLIGECGAIAAGLSLTRIRGCLVLPPMSEVVSGLAVDGRGALRGGHVTGTVLRTLIFCGSIATIVLGTSLLVGALLSAAGL